MTWKQVHRNVLLSAVEVKDGPHVKQIIEENYGEPYGDALDGR